MPITTPNDTEQRIAALKAQAQLHFKNKAFSQALTLYQQGIDDIDDQDPTLWLNKGLMHEKLQQTDQAIPAFTQALALRENYAKAEAGLFRIFHHNQKNATTVIFGMVDLKLTTDGQVKILEFAPGMLSGWRGLQFATGKTITNYLGTSLMQLQLPRLILTHHPGAPFSRPGHLAAQLERLPPPQENFNPQRISDYRALCADMHGDINSQSAQVLPLDDPHFNFIAENKAWTHHAFIAANQTALRPWTQQFEKQYTPSISEDIKAAKPNTRQFVIKFPTLDRGEGVHIVTADELDIALQLILSPLSEFQRAAQYCISRYQDELAFSQQQAIERAEELSAYMNNCDSDHSPYFLVEEYLSGQPVQYNGNDYDPTMRVAFLWSSDQTGARFSPFAAYWKLPPKAIDAMNTTTAQRSISSFTENRHTAVAVSPGIQRDVFSQLQPLREVVKQMVCMAIWPRIKQDTLNPIKQAETWLHYQNCLLKIHPLLASICLNQAKQLGIAEHRYQHQQGIAHYYQGQYPDALRCYSTALQLEATHFSSYYRLMELYYTLGNVGQMEKTHQRLINKGPNPSSSIYLKAKGLLDFANAYPPITTANYSHSSPRLHRPPHDHDATPTSEAAGAQAAPTR